MSKPPRLVDVAKEAGVSVQAASHVMSGNMTVRIPESTRERVREAAKKVGYVPNRLAQAMKSGKSNVISIWLSLERPSEVYFKMLKLLSRKAKASGYSLMIIGVDNDLAYRGQGDQPGHWPVDGIIALDAGKALNGFRADPNNDRIPVAVLALEQFVNGDTIGWDVAGGAKSAVKKIINSGRKHIVHITPRWIFENYPREQRRRGYSEAMREVGLEPVFVIPEMESNDQAQFAMQSYIADQGVPEAVFGFTDNLAIGAARAVLGAGTRIPEDCWVIGVGNTSEASDYRVPLSSLGIPVEALIDQTWTWLIDRIENPRQETRMVVLPMELVERESTES